MVLCSCSEKRIYQSLESVTSLDSFMEETSFKNLYENSEEPHQRSLSPGQEMRRNMVVERNRLPWSVWGN